MWLTQNTAHKDVVRRRLKRGKRNRQWVGIGYTPRYVPGCSTLQYYVYDNRHESRNTVLHTQLNSIHSMLLVWLEAIVAL